MFADRTQLSQFESKRELCPIRFHPIISIAFGFRLSHKFCKCLNSFLQQFPYSHRRINLLLWFSISLRLFVSVLGFQVLNMHTVQYCLFCYLFSLSSWYRIILLWIVNVKCLFFFLFFYQQLSVFSMPGLPIYLLLILTFIIYVECPLKWYWRRYRNKITSCSWIGSESDRWPMGNGFMLSVFVVSS